MAEMVDISKVNKIKKDCVYQMIDAVRKHDIVKKLIIFGSAVTDHCTNESDIDICADVSYQEKGLKLYRLGADLARICHGNCDILFYDRLKGKTTLTFSAMNCGKTESQKIIRLESPCPKENQTRSMVFP